MLFDNNTEEGLLIRYFEKVMEESTHFLRDGATLMIELGNHPLTLELSQEILRILAKYPKVRIKSITTSEERMVRKVLAPKLHKGTLRSGAKISHNGDLIILGDVNQGATVIADGDIIVVGSLRGVAHAGAFGDARRIIYAGQFNPIQVRIADCIAVAPQSHTVTDPELARVVENRIIVESWRDGMKSAKQLEHVWQTAN